jgi:UDP-glucose 4-epimerase
MSRTALVLGGAGFLGRTLSRALLRSGGWQVSSGDVVPASVHGVSDVDVDILDREDLARVCQPFELVFNCTGQITQPMHRCLLLNTIGISNIAYACSMAKRRLTHLSTVSVYGSAHHVDETAELNPESAYAASKACAELILGSSMQPDSLTIVRLSNLYGPGQTKGLLAYLLRSFHSDLRLVFDNTGDLLRHYLHVEDAAAALVGVAVRGAAGTFNLVGPERYSIREVVNLIEARTGVKFQVSYEDATPRENIDTISVDRVNGILDVAYRRTIPEFIDRYFRRDSAASS